MTVRKHTAGTSGPVAGYSLPLSCQACGEPVRALTQGKPDGWDSCATCECVGCGRVFVVNVSMRPISTPECRVAFERVR